MSAITLVRFDKPFVLIRGTLYMEKIEENFQKLWFFQHFCQRVRTFPFFLFLYFFVFLSIFCFFIVNLTLLAHSRSVVRSWSQ